jgi:septal ring-binding cell division protein DamX
MASGGKRGGAGERVLEGRHVIGLFFLMLLFSGVFFTLGYVMGRNQYDGQVRAESSHDLTAAVSPKPAPGAKHGESWAANSDPSTDTSTPPSSDWEFYRAGDKKLLDDHLKRAHPAKTVDVSANPAARPKTTSAVSHAPMNPAGSARGAYSLQVAALTKEADAMMLATNLQKKKFPAFVLSPQSDKFYRVQVGPYADQKSAEAAKKGLESAGFKAIVKH